MGALKLFKFLLLLISLSFAFSELVCPPKCQCAGTTVRCLHQELTSIPKPPAEAATLDLRFNKIYEIAPGLLSHLHRLRSLLLNDNQLVALRSGAFHGLRRLKYLYLYRNRIQHIDPDVFQHMQHLEQLYLHVNEIKHIQPGTFSNMPRLERLYLHNNMLTHLPQGSFRGMPRLRKLRLDSNALVCDCSMLWFVRMLADHQDMSIAATCHGPPGMTGTAVSSMTEQHLHCSHPEMMKEPEDLVISFGRDAVFNCMATGEPAPEIIWFRDSTKVSLDTTHYEIMDNGTLMIHEVDENDVGIFECMAKNPLGEVRSRSVRMIVENNDIKNDHPVFTVFPRKQTAKLHEPEVHFDCVASGDPTPHITWLFNGVKMLLDERISLKNNGSLYIKNIQDKDTGTYTCVAENVKGYIDASASLEVLVSPALIVVPSDKTAYIGDQVKFKCTARGSPKPTISWFRNTMALPPSENIVLSDDNQKLTIKYISEDDEGIYHCRAENSEGIAEISALLKVESYKIVTPKIILKPEDIDAFRETSVQLTCETESEPPATIEWRKDGTRIATNSRIVVSVVGSLIINNVTVRDTGRYECSVYNEYGRDTASAFLNVKDHILPGDEYVKIALTEATRDVDQAIEHTIEHLFQNKNAKVDIHDLFQIVRYPNAGARQIARAAEIYERALEKVKGFVQAGRTVTSAEPFNYNNVLSAQHLEIIARLSGCVAHRLQIDCSDMCYHRKYRTFDGTCNNFANPMWGASLTGFRRILYPVYENGFSEPVGWNRDRKYNGFILPGARSISTSIISTEEITEDIKISHMAMQWGQWLDHDLDHSLPPLSAQSWDGVDCKKTCEYAAPCFPIDVPRNDSRVSNRRCIDFIRTSAVCGSGITSVLFGKLQPREQINQLTSFLDASQVYGFEKSVAQDLRDLTNENGMLRVGAVYPGGKPLLPTLGINGMDCRRNLEESSLNCFVAGDIRANEQIGLAAMHTVWMREHNRVAMQLKTINPFWDGDKVYNEARKIIGAESQVITYEHWLPVVLGPDVHKYLGEYKGYDPKINPAVSNVFATAALRFGHTLINPILHRYDENFDPIPQGHLLLRNAFFSPWRLVEEGGVDPLLRGMFMTPAKLKTPKQNLNSELTEQLFYSAHAVALDLAAINIQRGRDHGIPPYTKWREFCNMSEVNNFDDLAGEISDPDVRSKLETLYGSVHNIDVWVGGVLEDQVKGGKVGPLFRCLLLEQFKRLRDGDRFWYENPSVFKPEQLRELKQTSLAKVLCDNGDHIDSIGENVFLLPEVQEGLIACEDLPAMDLRYWADCESCSSEEGEDENSDQRTRREAKIDIIEKGSRLEVLEDNQNDLEKTVDVLKKRIEFLEENCMHEIHDVDFD